MITYKPSKDIILDIDVNPIQINRFISKRVTSQSLKPELIEPDKLKKPKSYKRFQGLDKKEIFRKKLLQTLFDIWEKKEGEKEAILLKKQFLNLIKCIDENGAIMFGKLIESNTFKKLVTEYDEILSKSGSKTWIHSYVNLGNHAEFLNTETFNGAFLHPLLISLISYRIGAPVRMVDARGKDAAPISVLAQDNMLHIDNTPFNDEYKIILTWEKGTSNGPKGQNFVFIPGTHKGVRNCFISNNKVWSCENSSIFIKQKDVEKIFSFQQKIENFEKPTVIELHNPDNPTTTVFAAGSLIHHRYRTDDKKQKDINYARSCIILAFHSAIDNPGKLPEQTSITLTDKPNLIQFLFGHRTSEKEITDEFIELITENASEISNKLIAIENNEVKLGAV